MADFPPDWMKSIFMGIQKTNEPTIEQVRDRVEAIYRTESRRIFATLIRLLGDFDLAEDANYRIFLC